MDRTGSRRERIGMELVTFLACLTLFRLELSTAAPTLPPIWNEVALDDEAESLGVFRILSEVHLDDRSSYQLEERLDGPHMRFRLDVLPLHGDGGEQLARSNGRPKTRIDQGKKTFLVDGPSSERFFFEPFKCFNLNQMENNNDDDSKNSSSSIGSATTTMMRKFIDKEAKLGELFKYFPEASLKSSSTILGGLGAIWVAALNSKAPVKFKQAKARSSIVEGRRRGKSKTEVMQVFDKFSVEPSESFQYRIDFYFMDRSGQDAAGPAANRDGGDLVAVHLIDPNYNKVKLSARVISLDLGLASIPSSQSLGSSASGSGSGSPGELGGNLFELPLGYGCARRGASGRKLDYAPPRNCFHTSQPHSCYLEASVWVPPARGSPESQSDEDDELDLDQWRQHVSNMRIISGRLLGRNYVSLEATDFAPSASSQAELNLDTLEADGQTERWQRELRPGSIVTRRARRIWDLGQRTITAADDTQTGANNFSGQTRWKPMHFGLADHLRSCVAVGEAELYELPSIDFELHDFDEQSGTRQKNRTSYTVGLSLIDEKMLADFFQNADGFRLVREDAESWRRFQSVHQERRVERFEFRDPAGEVNWVGPVSIIRKFYFEDALGERLDSIENEPVGGKVDSNQPEVPLEALRVELTLIVLSRMLDKQLARLRLVMSPGLLVDEAHLHRELDIGPCLETAAIMASNSCRPRWRPPPSASRPQLTSDFGLDLALVYPLEEPIPGGQLDGARSQIYSQFLNSISSEALLGSNGFKLNVLQVNQVQVDIEPEFVRVSCRINKWPHSYDYVHHATTRPDSSSKVRVFLRELKPNAELCARTCSHYQCPLFVFGFTSNFCELYEFLPHLSASSNPREQLIELHNDFSSDTYQRRDGASRPYAEPRFVLARMRETLLDSLGSDDPTNALAIRLELEQAGLKVDLLPESLHVGNEQWRQDRLLLEADRLKTAGQTSSSKVVIDEDKSFELGYSDWKLEIEFVYLMRNYKFKLDDQVGHSQEFPVAEARHLSQAECELLCLENDCRSYSYCDLNKSCIVSKLMGEANVKARSEREDFCKLMGVDQMSKFQATARQVVSSSRLAQLTGSASGKTEKNSGQLVFRFNSQRDCATACLETSEFVCKSFFFCRKSTNQVSGSLEEGDCHLFAERQSGALLRAEFDKRHLSSGTVANDSADSCDFYQRSYLADYHEFHGKRLAELGGLTGGQQRQVEIRLGLGAEECAAECSQEVLSDLDAPLGRARVCRAFEVCFSGEQRQKYKRQQLTCGLLIEDSQQRESGAARRVSSLLADGPKCTAFVRLGSHSDGSKRTLGDSQGGDDELELEAMSEDTQAESVGVPRGVWWSTVAAVSLGMALGYTISFVVARIARWRRRRRVDAVN